MPLPHAHRRCRCGGMLDVFGDHRAACPVTGVLGPRGAPLERAAARVCREGGARVATNVFLRDMNIDVPLADSRRIEVLANGLPLWQGAQAAVDTTFVSPVLRWRISSAAWQPRRREQRQLGSRLQRGERLATDGPEKAREKKNKNKTKQ